MSAGALRCLAYFRWCWKVCGPDQCWPKLRYLATKLKTSIRTLTRWIAELRLKNCVNVVQRGRRGALFLPVVGVDCGVDAWGVYRKELFEVKSKTKPADSPVEKPEHEFTWSPTEREAVSQILGQFRYAGGQWVDPGPLVGRLERIGIFYGANGFRVAAEFAHVIERVKRSPSTAPERPAWFCAVLEARLQRSMGVSKSIHRELSPHGRAVAGTPISGRDPKSVSAPRFVGWSAEEMAALERGLNGEAAEPVAQSPAPIQTTDPGKREWCDTRALVSGIAGGKAMPEGIKRESLEALYAAVKSA